MLKRNAKSKILSLCIFAAMLLFVIGILYFGYLMVMRAQWTVSYTHLTLPTNSRV